MERCRRDDRRSSTIKGPQRQVACWLHDGDPGVAVPVELTSECERPAFDGAHS